MTYGVFAPQAGQIGCNPNLIGQGYVNFLGRLGSEKDLLG